ncbi:MAG: hypothetical protein IJA65_02120 [Acholeplasmatales bacterium]|nr:hypothetical protein [Acholeplasmatales bacterium]
MQYVGIPSIITICYLIGEIFKLLILKTKTKYKLVPIIVGTFGGLLGLLAYYISPSIVLDVESPFIATSLGIVSGLASTGSYEVITKLLSQITKKENMEEK